MNDDLKSKVQQLIEKKNTLEIESEVLKSLYYPLYDLLKEKTQEAISNNNIEILKSALEEFIVQNHQDIITSVKELVEDQHKMIKSSVEQNRKVDELVSQSVQELTKEIAGFAKINNISSIENKLTESINRVVNFIQSTNQQPDKIEYRRNKNGKIAGITESYQGYTVTQVWKYDTDGYLTSVITKRSDEAA